MTTPSPAGTGAAKAMKLAIEEAGLQPSDIAYVNAHRTSTQANEKVKVKRLLVFLEKKYQFLLRNLSQVTFLVQLVQ